MPFRLNDSKLCFMRTLLRLLIDAFNFLHLLFVDLTHAFSIELNDKQLHFYVIGIAFLVVFIFLNAVFKWLSKYSVSIITFIVVFTFSIVVTLAIEVGQFQSGSGQMDFKDVIWGLYGVVVFVGFYVLTVSVLKLILKRVKIKA